MATQTSTNEAAEVAGAFARAYSVADWDATAALLHPSVAYREITPRQIVEATGPAAIVEEGREFLSRRESFETLELAFGQVGTRGFARTRWRLVEDGEPKVVDWCQYMTVEDGLITALDAVCSGPMPEL